MKNFLASEAIVNFDDIKVIRSKARNFVGMARGPMPDIK